MSEENTGKTDETAKARQEAPVRNKKKGEGPEKPETLHLKTKPVPPIVMLSGGLLVAVVVFVQQLDLKKSLLTILVGLLFFLIIGDLVKLLLDRIEIPNPELMDADGNVIEKGKSGDENESDASASPDGDGSGTNAGETGEGETQEGS